MNLDNRVKKAERLKIPLSDGTMSSNKYNCLIGLVICYGFAANALIVHFCKYTFLHIPPLVLALLYFVCSAIGISMAYSSRSPLFSFIGYNFVVLPVGVLMSILLQAYSWADISLAMGVTGVAVLVMMVAATIRPHWFENLRGTLFISLLSGLVAELIFVIFGYRGNLFNWLFVFIFIIYIGVDWNQAQRYAKTLDNAIDSSLDIYLDIINLFLRLLQIFARSKDND